MCEVVGVELYWKLIAKMMGLVCEVVARFLHGVVFMLVIESNMFYKLAVFHQMKINCTVKKILTDRKSVV